MAKIFLAAIILLQSNLLLAQDSSYNFYAEKTLCLVAGGAYGSGYNKDFGLLDIGIAINKDGSAGHHPATAVFFASNEFILSNKLVLGPKIGVWGGGGAAGMAMGLNMIFYTDFGQGSLVFRPEVGFGFGHFKVVYGYNARLVNTNFEAAP